MRCKLLEIAYCRITRYLFNVPCRPPTYEDAVRRPYERVAHAYRKACGMIEDVGRHLSPQYEATEI